VRFRDKVFCGDGVGKMELKDEVEGEEDAEGMSGGDRVGGETE
jgi:hypothetical protein